MFLTCLSDVQRVKNIGFLGLFRIFFTTINPGPAGRIENQVRFMPVDPVSGTVVVGSVEVFKPGKGNTVIAPDSLNAFLLQ